jgi:hypothetical protein
MLLLGAPLGHLLLGAPAVRFFPSVAAQVYPKHAETIRYLLAVIAAIGLAIADRVEVHGGSGECGGRLGRGGVAGDGG